jgi:hypothetical protein
LSKQPFRFLVNARDFTGGMPETPSALARSDPRLLSRGPEQVSTFVQCLTPRQAVTSLESARGCSIAGAPARAGVRLRSRPATTLGTFPQVIPMLECRTMIAARGWNQPMLTSPAAPDIIMLVIAGGRYRSPNHRSRSFIYSISRPLPLIHFTVSACRPTRASTVWSSTLRTPGRWAAVAARSVVAMRIVTVIGRRGL